MERFSAVVNVIPVMVKVEEVEKIAERRTIERHVGIIFVDDGVREIVIRMCRARECNRWVNSGNKGKNRRGENKSKTGRDEARPDKFKIKWLEKLALLGGFSLNRGEGQREARFVAVAGILVQHTLGDCLVDRGHRWMKKIARGGGVAGGDCRAQTPHQSADPGAVGTVHFGALTRLRRPLQNRLFLLLNFGSLSLGHLLLLLCIAQTSNVKRGHGLCQTRRKVLPARKCRRRR